MKNKQVNIILCVLKPNRGQHGEVEEESKADRFSKKSMGDFTGPNFEGAHHLNLAAKSQIRCKKNLVAHKKLFKLKNN